MIAALAFVACAKETPPPREAKSGAAVAEAPGRGAKPVDSVAAPEKAGEKAWVAKADKVVVDQTELLAYARMTSPQGFEGKSLEDKRDLALRLVVRKAAAADAERRGLGKDPSVVRTEFEWKFETYPALYWAETVEKEVRFDDKDLRAILRPEAQYLLGAMVFGDDAAAEEHARRVHGLLKGGGSFETLAREQSEGFLAAKGGDMGWVTLPNFMVEAMEAAVIAKIPPGAFTEPLHTRLGWTIFRVREKADVEEIFAAKKEQELPALLRQRIDEAKVLRIRELRERAAITYPAEQAGAPAGAPAAVVNGYAFPADRQMSDTRSHGGVPQSVTPAKQQLEKTIDTFLLVLEAERLGIGDRPEQQLNLRLRRMEMLAQLQFRSAASSVVVTDAELREEHRRFYVPDVYEFQIIVADSRERAAEALKRSRGGEDFSALAKEYNTGQLAKNGGLVPLGSPSQYSAAVQKTLPALADGGVSGVLDQGNGTWAVIKRRAKQVVPPPLFELVEDKIRKRLELQKRADLTKAMVDEYRNQLKVSFNENLLAKL